MMQALMNQGTNIEKRLQDQSSVVQKLGNEIVSLKRQQAQNYRHPPQQIINFPHNRKPPNQGQASVNQGRFSNSSPTTNTNANPQRAIVPQNNLAQEQYYCPSCYYDQCVCQKGESSQALVVQEKVGGQPHGSDGSESQQGEHSFMNHQPEEYCHVNHDDSDSIAQNTRSKRRA